MNGTDNPRAYLDQYAAALRDVRQAAGAPRPEYAAAPVGSVSSILECAARLAAEDGTSLLVAAIAGTLAMHLPDVRAEHIGAVLLDLSEFMTGFVDHPDTAEGRKAAQDLPALVALVGQEMYSGGAR